MLLHPRSPTTRRRPPRTLILLLLLSGPARARASVGQVEEARALYKEAESLRQAGQPAAALLRYRRAYALVPTPMILLGQAEAYRDLHRTQDALAVLRRVDEQGLPAEERQRACVLRAALFSLSAWPAELRPWSGDPFLATALASSQAGARRAAPDRLSRSLGWGKWAAGAAGLTLAVVGGALWGASLQDDGGQGGGVTGGMAPAGMALLGAGISGITLSALFFGLDAGRSSLTKVD